MNVFFLIGMAMVMPMIGGPPEDAFLAGCLRRKGQKELPQAIYFERAMAEVTVVAGSDGEHAHGVEHSHQRDPLPAESNKENREATCVDQKKRNGLHNAEAFPKSSGLSSAKIGLRQSGFQSAP